MSAEEHRDAGKSSVSTAVLTVTDTRTLESDHGGALIIELLNNAGHEVVDRELVPDDPMLIAGMIEQWGNRDDVDAILLTGGTGIAPRDLTYETIDAMLSKPMPGYGELFRLLSYQEIGAAAMLSRAIGGVYGMTVVLTMPGSTAAVRLAMEKLILPELSHLVQQATKF